LLQLLGAARAQRAQPIPQAGRGSSGLPIAVIARSARRGRVTRQPSRHCRLGATTSLRQRQPWERPSIERSSADGEMVRGLDGCWA
jgi:hypothetical protein